MAATYRLDIRYISQGGESALERVGRLSGILTDAGYKVSEVAVFDDGVRVSALITTDAPGRIELKVLSVVSQTGSIGRFSCRDAEKPEPAAEAIEAEAVLV